MDHVTVEGDTAVVQQTLTATTRKGATYRNEYCWVYTCSGGKVARMVEYTDSSTRPRSSGWSPPCVVSPRCGDRAAHVGRVAGPDDRGGHRPRAGHLRPPPPPVGPAADGGATPGERARRRAAAREDRYLVDELLADTGAGHRVLETVFVECGSAYRADGPAELRPVGETEFVVAAAREAERRPGNATRIAGIVAFADLRRGAAVGRGAGGAPGGGRRALLRHPPRGLLGRQPSGHATTGPTRCEGLLVDPHSRRACGPWAAPG